MSEVAMQRSVTEGSAKDVLVRRGARVLYRGVGAWRPAREGESPDGSWGSVLAVRKFHGRTDNLTVEIDGAVHIVHSVGPSRSGPGFARLFLEGAA